MAADNLFEKALGKILEQLERIHVLDGKFKLDETEKLKVIESVSASFEKTHGELQQNDLKDPALLKSVKLALVSASIMVKENPGLTQDSLELKKLDLLFKKKEDLTDVELLAGVKNILTLTNKLDPDPERQKQNAAIIDGLALKMTGHILSNPPEAMATDITSDMLADSRNTPDAPQWDCGLEGEDPLGIKNNALMRLLTYSPIDTPLEQQEEEELAQAFKSDGINYDSPKPKMPY